MDMNLQSSPSRHLDTSAGTAVYSSFGLKLYDAWVLGFSNCWAWRCPTGSVLLPFYREYLGKRHLDVGVGTGFYLAHAGFTERQKVDLLDLNENSLRKAVQRLGRPDAGLYAQDVMQPLTALRGRQYDSISLFYLLHCLPGSAGGKGRVFANLKRHLNDEGVIYGATVLGDSVGHNRVGRTLMTIYNRKGIFGNREDTIETLSDSLNRHFGHVDVRQHGKVALFAARWPNGEA